MASSTLIKSLPPSSSSGSESQTRCVFSQLSSDRSHTFHVDFMAPEVLTSHDIDTLLKKIDSINAETLTSQARLSITICVEYKKWGIWVTIERNSATSSAGVNNVLDIFPAVV